MKAKWGMNLVLALLLISLGLFTYWLEFSRKPKKTEAEEEERKLFPLKDLSVRSILIVDGTRRFELSCLDIEKNLCKPGEQSQWEVTVPAKFAGDKANINSYLSSLNNTMINESISLAEDTPEKRAQLLKDYGLDADARAAADFRRIEVTYSGAGSKEPKKITAYFGGTHPIGDKTFSVVARDGKLDDQRVLLVPNYFKSNFDHNLTYWRDKKLISIPSGDVVAFDLRNAKGRLHAAKTDGSWTLYPNASGPTPPKNPGLPGDIENVDGIVTGATFLSAKDFVTDNRGDAKGRAALSGAKEAIEIALYTKEKTPLRLKLYEKKTAGSKGGSPSQWFATVEGQPTLYELQPSAKDRLDKGLKELRMTRLITSLERFSIKRIEFAFRQGADAGKTLALFNQDAKWVDLNDSSHAIDGNKVSQFLDKISGNKITDFLDGAKAPAGESAGLVVTLGEQKDDVKRKLVFWRSGDLLYARDLTAESAKSAKANARNEVYQIDSVVKDGIPKDRGFFAPKTEPPKAEPKSASHP